MTERHPQTGKTAINKRRNTDVPARLAIASVARQHDYVAFITERHRPLHRYGIHDSTIQHRLPVYHDHGTNVWQAARSFGYPYQSVIILFLRQIIGTPRQAIGGHHLEHPGIGPVSLEIVRHDALREILVQQFLVQYAMLRPQKTHTDIFVFFKHVDITVLRPPALAAHIGQAIARPCRHGHRVGKINVMVE